MTAKLVFGWIFRSAAKGQIFAVDFKETSKLIFKNLSRSTSFSGSIEQTGFWPALEQINNPHRISENSLSLL
jgi:hypothetical protein